MNPCVNICRLGNNGKCLGCGRTETQIFGWESYTSIKKEQILQEIKNANNEIKHV